MLQDGLGLKPSAIEVASLRERLGLSGAAEPGFLAPYYDSEEPAGPKRLLEITAESAFFTRGLSRTASQVLGVIVVVGLSGVLFGLILIIQAGVSQPALDAAAKVTLIGVAIWATGDMASMAIRFHALAHAADHVLGGVENIVSRNRELRDDALIVFGEYNCAVLQAPPIPAAIYKWRQGVLNEAWRKRGTREGADNSAR